jgi:hypothetical protein
MFRVVALGTVVVVAFLGVVTAREIWRTDSADALSNKHIWAALQIRYSDLSDNDLQGLPVVYDLVDRGQVYRTLVVDALDTERKFALLLLDDDINGREVFWFPYGARLNFKCLDVAGIIDGERVLPSVSEFLRSYCAS